VRAISARRHRDGPNRSLAGTVSKIPDPLPANRSPGASASACCEDPMPLAETDLLLTAFALLAGAGLYLRIIAKEKHRREKWLQFRQETRIKELKQKQQQAREEEEKVTVVH
jgi:hypothetical protein